MRTATVAPCSQVPLMVTPPGASRSLASMTLSAAMGSMVGAETEVKSTSTSQRCSGAGVASTVRMGYRQAVWPLAHGAVVICGEHIPPTGTARGQGDRPGEGPVVSQAHAQGDEPVGFFGADQGYGAAVGQVLAGEVGVPGAKDRDGGRDGRGSVDEDRASGNFSTLVACGIRLIA